MKYIMRRFRKRKCERRELQQESPVLWVSKTLGVPRRHFSTGQRSSTLLRSCSSVSGLKVPKPLGGGSWPYIPTSWLIAFDALWLLHMGMFGTYWILCIPRHNCRDDNEHHPGNCKYWRSYFESCYNNVKSWKRFYAFYCEKKVVISNIF